MGPMISKPEIRPLDHSGAADPRFEELDDQFSEEKTLARIRLLWNKRLFLVRCLLVGFVVATFIAFLIPKRFEATAQLMPPDTESAGNIAMMAGLAGPSGLGTLAGDLLGIKGTGALFIGVLRSRTVQDRIVDRFDLKKIYQLSLEASAREELAGRTVINEDRKSGIIAITVTDRDPKRAAAMAGAYVEELNTLIAQVSTSSARRERIFLEDRLGAVKQDLEGAERDFSQFASSKGAIDIPAQGKAMVEEAATLEGHLIAAQSELEGLKQIYSDNNVRVRSTQARINELGQQLRKLGGKAGNTLDSANDPAADALYPTLRQLPILGVPFADKLRRLKIQEAVFETLTKQYELAKVQEAKEVPSVKELDVPVVPEYKSFPPRLMIIASGVFCTTLVGVVWVLGRASWKEIDPRDPRKEFAQEVFHTFAAHIPWASRNGASGALLETEAKEDDQPTARSAGAGASG